MRAFLDLKAQCMVPMHYGAFRLGFESMGEPPDRLLGEARNLGLESRLRMLDEGETLVL